MLNAVLEPSRTICAGYRCSSGENIFSGLRFWVTIIIGPFVRGRFEADAIVRVSFKEQSCPE